MSKISLIIPFKNTELIWINKLFDSLEKQINKNFEVICIDDSSDNGIDYKTLILEKGYRYYRSNNASLGDGVGKLRDYGVSVAKGDLIWFVDSDDWITPDATDYLINSFEEHKDIDLVVFKYQWVYKESDVNFKERKITSFVSDNTPNRRMNKWFHTDYQTDWRVCFKKEFLLKNEILHKENLLLYEDVYFGLIWKTIYKKALFSSKILYFYNRMNRFSTLNQDKNFDPHRLLLNILSSKDNLIKRNIFNEKWFFYANNWAFVAASYIYKDRKQNKSLIKDVIGPKHCRNYKMLGFGSRWFVSNFLVWRPLLMIILRKIFKFKAKANNN
ncbi:glycosyltransferase family 2 protein [Malacoplasma penetrans]|uniref:Glycosyltransferase n=1 Tax=Malacoplasma penetrans (strain HF-2) TaxID=272633 RepID=Q8EUN8_MALP2|nr:glycosyltransferase family A protein [Malacoplasma penetrans]RXY97087.1 glycosyltransferase family 2 protein [Malacoplasma penetrans]BAC44674.1 putative glycosyltransferase [Malacoplasma penetrans HF-2]